MQKKTSRTNNSNKTLSILQRVPVILAVTAASYGLSHAQVGRTQGADARPLTSKTAPAAPTPVRR